MLSSNGVATADPGRHPGRSSGGSAGTQRPPSHPGGQQHWHKPPWSGDSGHDWGRGWGRGDHWLLKLRPTMRRVNSNSMVLHHAGKLEQYGRIRACCLPAILLCACTVPGFRRSRAKQTTEGAGVPARDGASSRSHHDPHWPTLRFGPTRARL